jgi:potassium efflux system protein
MVATVLNAFALNLDAAASGGSLGALAMAVLATSIITAAVRLLRHNIFTDNRVIKTALRLTVGMATVVISMQLMGLLFAAGIYMVALGRSIVLILVIKTVSDIMERWLLILRARLERKTRDEMKAQDEEGDGATEESEDWVDVISLSDAHSKLLTLARLVALAVVLWVIWAPSLPALNLLDSVTLWQVADSADPEVSLRAITLFDIAVSIFILVITALVAKHLPSLMQVIMLEWMNISAGARYASGILMQYLVIAIGGSMFLTTVGWEWSKVQWLVAAMGVGIGFGLQEIVANFISGLIILFERPIRVGDIISAGGAEGTVKKIKPRATIIETGADHRTGHQLVPVRKRRSRGDSRRHCLRQRCTPGPGPASGSRERGIPGAGGPRAQGHLRGFWRQRPGAVAALLCGGGQAHCLD